MSTELKGLVFDIRRFSTHDGAGIRTTVFLKGCPLRCVWCQNPEGIAFSARLLHFSERCIGCGSCLLIEDGAMRQKADMVMCLDGEKVMQPEKYEAICPAAALRMDSHWYDIEEIMTKLLRDQVFFQHGGGVTLSGGEPFFQGKFTRQLLSRLKAAGVHTAVESSLCADWSIIEAALPLLDTVYADFKIFNSVHHKQATGVTNEIICDNLRRLLQSPYRDNVIVRTPLIPKFTAVPDNIRQIAGQLATWYPAVRYELLNYNPLAKAKYVHVDFEYCFADNLPLYSKQQVAEFYQIARQAGIKNLIEDTI